MIHACFIPYLLKLPGWFISINVKGFFSSVMVFASKSKQKSLVGRYILAALPCSANELRVDYDWRDWIRLGEVR